jgi:hypothetical protein
MKPTRSGSSGPTAHNYTALLQVSKTSTFTLLQQEGYFFPVLLLGSCKENSKLFCKCLILDFTQKEVTKRKPSVVQKDIGRDANGGFLTTLDIFISRYLLNMSA